MYLTNKLTLLRFTIYTSLLIVNRLSLRANEYVVLFLYILTSLLLFRSALYEFCTVFNFIKFHEISHCFRKFPNFDADISQ